MMLRACLTAALAIACCALSACSSPDPAYYTLEPVPGPVIAAPAVTVEVRRPGLAGYLDRSDVVLKDSQFRLSVNSQLRWAEPLGDMVGRVITQDLAQRLPASHVFAESGAITADPDLRLEIDVDRFDPSQDGAVLLSANVAVEEGLRHHALQARTITLNAPAGSGAAALAGAMSQLLGRLSDEVAQDIAAAAAKRAAQPGLASPGE